MEIFKHTSSCKGYFKYVAENGGSETALCPEMSLTREKVLTSNISVALSPLSLAVSLLRRPTQILPPESVWSTKGSTPARPLAFPVACRPSRATDRDRPCGVGLAVNVLYARNCLLMRPNCVLSRPATAGGREGGRKALSPFLVEWAVRDDGRSRM